MAYHSEVLQKERDLQRRIHLSPAAVKSEGVKEDVTIGLRQAGGGGHPLFTAMAEAALAQVDRTVFGLVRAVVWGVGLKLLSHQLLWHRCLCF